MDKSTAMIDFLKTCPTISANPLFFNFSDVREDAFQANQQSVADGTTKFVDGSVEKRYIFYLDTFKGISYNPVVNSQTDENIADIQEVQAVLDWINNKGENREFPSFGTGYVIDEMKTSSSTPILATIDTNANPPIAIYRIEIQITYLDYTRAIWYTQNT